MGDAIRRGSRGLALLALIAVTSGCGDAAAQLTVELANDTDDERATRERLLELVREHDVSDWIHTDRVIIDRTETPHSHPVLTLHTRHLGDDDMLLSTFVHEQFHWLEQDDTYDAFRAAMDDFAEMYPDAPAREGGGARDVESTYRHLLVCDMELQAMTILIGEDAARDLMARVTHYEWIYARVLDDPRVREVAERHGFLLEG